MASIGLGFRAIKGGSVVVGVKIAERVPRLLLSTFLPTAAEGDRIAFEPYHVAVENIAEAASIIAEGRARQAKLAAEDPSEHPPIAEGLAVRDALRSAFAVCGVGFVEIDEKSLPANDPMLKEFGAAAGRPWRKEQKLAALAA